MDCRLVFTARLQIRLPDCHVDCAADFFVEQNIFGQLRNAVICANGGFAKTPCAFDFKDFIQIILTAFGFPTLDKAVFDPQSCLFDFMPVVDAWKTELNSSIHRIFDGRCINFAAWHIGLPVRIHPNSVFC